MLATCVLKTKTTQWGFGATCALSHEQTSIGGQDKIVFPPWVWNRNNCNWSLEQDRHSSLQPVESCVCNEDGLQQQWNGKTIPSRFRRWECACMEDQRFVYSSKKAHTKTLELASTFIDSIRSWAIYWERQSDLMISIVRPKPTPPTITEPPFFSECRKWD